MIESCELCGEDITASYPGYTFYYDIPEWVYGEKILDSKCVCAVCARKIAEKVYAEDQEKMDKIKKDPWPPVYGGVIK